MAKKKAKKKTAGPKYPKKRAMKATAAAPNARVRKPGPRSQALPGMAQARNVRLDNFCEAIAEDRATMNAAKASELGNVQGALREMQRPSDKYPDGRTVYKHGGVELARVPGADKLRVRLTKEQGDADESGLTSSGEAADEGTDNDQLGDERRDAIEELGGDTAGEIH